MVDKETVYLVLGANGFIGSYLVEYLASQPHSSVKAFDRFSHGPQFDLKENIEVVKGDIFNLDDVRAALVGVTRVVHCFSATTPFTADNNPYLDLSDNLLASVKLFDLCASQGIEKVGFVSSGGAVYGSVTEHKVATEDDAPLPVSPYGISKLAIEHYLEFFKRKHGMDYTVYRLTNPYGPRQVSKHNQGVIPIFLQRIVKGEEIFIYGDGTSSRDFIYIEDAVAMIVDSFVSQNRHSVYNIGRGVQTSLNQILEEMTALTGKQPRIAYNEAPKTFLHSTGVSIDRYMDEFGERSFTSLRDGLSATIRQGNQ